LSDSARQVLEAAVGLNPDGARQLLAILRTAPAAVKYKPQDRFGPLGMMVNESGGADATPGFGRPGLPQEHHAAAETFQQEWLAKSFSKVELANELEKLLKTLGEPVLPYQGPWQTVGGDSDRLDPLSRIFGPISDTDS
jgi:hypothetical protein